MNKIFIFLVSMALLFVSCKNGALQPENESAYWYTAYDSLGAKIVTGFLWLEFASSGSVTGHWCLQKIGNPDNIGPQTGTGKLTGNLQDSEIWINLNPDWADNNVNLTGKIEGTEIRGDWTYSGFVGMINHGTFNAHPVSSVGKQWNKTENDLTIESGCSLSKIN